MLRYLALMLAILLFLLPCMPCNRVLVDTSDVKTPLVAVQALPDNAALVPRLVSSDPLQSQRATGELNRSDAAGRFLALNTRGGRLSHARAEYRDRTALRCEQDSLRI